MDMTIEQLRPASRPPPAPRAPWITLILATYGRSTELAVVLDSLGEQTDRDFEVVVIDQNPDDRLVPVLAVPRGLNIRHLRQAEPNLSKARNTGLDEAFGEWVAFPDDDCWYEQDCLAQVRAAIRSEPDLDGVVGRWVEVAPGAAPSAHRLQRDAWRDFRGGDASSITLFLRTEAVRALDGFDPFIGVGQFYGAGEETDLLLRLLDKGRVLSYTPLARVHHHYSHEPVALSRKAWVAQRARARGVGAIYAKHRLGLKTIARGLLAPLFKPLAGRQPLRGVALGLAETVGRLEGMLRWPRSSGSERPDGASRRS